MEERTDPGPRPKPFTPKKQIPTPMMAARKQYRLRGGRSSGVSLKVWIRQNLADLQSGGKVDAIANSVPEPPK